MTVPAYSPRAVRYQRTHTLDPGQPGSVRVCVIPLACGEGGWWGEVPLCRDVDRVEAGRARGRGGAGPLERCAMLCHAQPDGSRERLRGRREAPWNVTHICIKAAL